MMNADVEDYFNKHSRVHKKLAQALCLGSINGIDYQNLCKLANSNDSDSLDVVDSILNARENPFQHTFTDIIIKNENLF